MSQGDKLGEAESRTVELRAHCQLGGSSPGRFPEHRALQLGLEEGRAARSRWGAQCPKSWNSAPHSTGCCCLLGTEQRDTQGWSSTQSYRDLIKGGQGSSEGQKGFLGKAASEPKIQYRWVTGVPPAKGTACTEMGQRGLSLWDCKHRSGVAGQ